MLHPGLPWMWAGPVLLGVVLLAFWAMLRPVGPPRAAWRGPVLTPPGGLTLTVLRLVVLLAFLFLVTAGFIGTPVPSSNIATVLTWTVWWTVVIILVLAAGTAWCAICPWNTLAVLLVRRSLGGTGPSDSTLDLKVPRVLRSVWPAFAMLCGLTWLELGVGVTLSPVATASLAVVMVILATLSLAVFERGAFCRHICPVGRTLGCYSQLAPIALRPRDHRPAQPQLTQQRVGRRQAGLVGKIENRNGHGSFLSIERAAL